MFCRLEMHHEILLTLSGCPGDVFMTSRETGHYEIIPDIPYIHPSEVSLINGLVSLGSYYKFLVDFISKQTSAIVNLTTPTDSEDDLSGLYLRALGFGINNVLEPYRIRLVEVEQECIADPHLPLSHIKHRFEQFQFILPSLDATVRHIKRCKLHGCQILSCLYERTACGVPSLKKCYENLLRACHGVLYKQLSSWMVHGSLRDDYNEFFIAVSLAPASVPAQKEEEEEEKQVSPTLRRYQIRHEFLPTYIPPRVAEKILFIGEALQVFLSKEPSPLSTLSTQERFSSQSTRQLSSHQLKFVKLLSELQRKEEEEEAGFSLRGFESCTSQIRDTVAEHLWLLLVEEADLISSLQVMKDHYLLGRGELFLTFLDISNSFMSLPPSNATQHDANGAFRQAMTKLGIDNDSSLQQFRLTVQAPPTAPPTSDKRSVPVTNSWDSLGLEYKSKWPLHILFTPSVLEKYNTLFKVLLSIRRAQMALQHTWYLQMSKRQLGSGLLWQLRVHMSFLIDNLQYYVQVDVLDVQFSQLINKINSTHDFESIKHAHDVYLGTLLTQLFTRLPPVSQGLSEIIDLCHQLHNLVQTMSDPLTAKEKSHIDRIAKTFSRQSSLLFRILSNVKTSLSSPHLAQLLLRIDYNKFFSSHSSLLGYTSSLTLS